MSQELEPTATTPSSSEGGVVRMCTKCETNPRVGKTKPWCRNCYNAHAAEYRLRTRPRVITETRPCAWCGDAFEWTSKHPNQDTCGRSCYQRKRWADQRPPEQFDPEGMKTCYKCGELKAEADYSPSQYVKKVGSGCCRACWRAYDRRWRAENVQKTSAATRRSRAGRLLRKYGAYTDDIDRIVEDQGGLCASCGGQPGAKGFHIDHDHVTDRFRALLCHGCNVAAGALRDDPEVARSLVWYLEKHHGYRPAGGLVLEEPRYETVSKL